MDIVSTVSGSVVFLFDETGTTALGTGFLLGYPTSDGSTMVVPLIATARHVIGDRDVILARYSTKTGGATGFVRYDLSSARASGDYWAHPDEGVDIVVFRTQAFTQFDFTVLPRSIIASRQVFLDEDIKPTDRVIFPTMLTNFMGTTRNYPVVRDGAIALIPDELVPMKFRVGAREISTQQQLILIDATSIPGASGSPVFLWPGPRLRNNSFGLGGGTSWLLGVMHGFYAAPREVLKIQVTGTVDLFAENSRIAIVFPSWRLLEILEQPLVAGRLAQLIAEDAAKPAASLEPAAPPAAPADAGPSSAGDASGA